MNKTPQQPSSFSSRVLMPEAVMAFRRALEPESDRGCALMAAAYLDVELDQLLRAFVVNDSRIAEVVFGQSRPVSTFSSRIDLAYLLGLIDEVAHRDLHLLRKIRNDFAHVHESLDFSEKGITARCREFNLNFREADAPPRKKFVSTAVGILAILHTAMVGRSRLVARKTPNLVSARESAMAAIAALSQEQESDQHKSAESAPPNS